MTQSDNIANPDITAGLESKTPISPKTPVAPVDFSEAELKVAAILGEPQESIPVLIDMALRNHSSSFVMELVRQGFDRALSNIREIDQKLRETLSASVNDGKMTQTEMLARLHNSGLKVRAMEDVRRSL